MYYSVMIQYQVTKNILITHVLIPTKKERSYGLQVIYLSS